MHASRRRPWERWCSAALVLLFCLALLGRGEPCACLTVDQLRKMDRCQLEELFTQAPLGRPFVGKGRGKLVHLVDRLPRVKMRVSDLVWRGKSATPDGCFNNRWIGGHEWIGSQYVIGPSWLDGKPAVIMEYAPGTALFANMHDELREVAPGLYMGPVYDRFPCPKFRGFVALQLECCEDCPACCR
jgi:hypothetical protein